MKPRGKTRIGVLERRQPLPPGRYWLNVPGIKRIDLMNGWLAAFKGSVTLENAEVSEPTIALPGLPARELTAWYLFRTSAPLVWLAADLGFPNVATSNVKTQADTSDRPPPEPGFFDQFLSGSGFGSLVLLGVALYIFTKAD